MSILTACGVAVLAGCSSQPASPSRFDGAGGSGAGSVVVTAECPKVADGLPDIEVSQSLRRTVARNLGLLEIQVASANQRLADTANAADPAAAQQAVLSTLANQRAVTIERIADAIDQVAQRPQNLGALATCTLNNGAAANPSVAPTGNATGSGTANNTANPTANPSANPSGNATGAAKAKKKSSTPSPSPSGATKIRVQAANASAKPTGNATNNSNGNGNGTTNNNTANPSANPSGNATGAATPNVSATPAATPPPAVQTRLLVCPSVADQIVIPRAVQSDVALELGLMELVESGANERLAAFANNGVNNGVNNGINNGTGNNANNGNGNVGDASNGVNNNGVNQGNGSNGTSSNGVEGFNNSGDGSNGVNNGTNNGVNNGVGANNGVNNGSGGSGTGSDPWSNTANNTAISGDQDAVLQGLARVRAASLNRIANLLNQSGGQAVQDLGNLVNCQLNNSGALIDNNPPTNAPVDANGNPVPSESVAPTTAAPAESSVPDNNGFSNDSNNGNGNGSGNGSNFGNNGVDNNGNGSNFGNGNGSDDDVWFADTDSGY
ncbi:hypothetical protein AB0K60_24435 [Thermopolyspora sp. NPDC052614]|uniref:hypothetical protein n=1 Tax=Thermopolyspora sp. NPDC052614 TaxID=3155682 RepID=UPI00342AF19D